MKIIEGKQAVLRPYQTEKECVLPMREQIVSPLKPVECKPRMIPCTGEIIRHVETQEPKDCILRRVSEGDMQKPVERSAQEILDITPPATTFATDIDDITINHLQTTEAQVIPATPELEQMMEKTESGMSRMKKKKWFADTILGITNSK